MSKHTPGPWRVGDAGATVFGPPQETLPPRVIANVDRRPIVPGEPLANARLIAAAPELLSALEMVASLPGFEAHEPYGAAVLSAIAKANGKGRK